MCPLGVITVSARRNEIAQRVRTTLGNGHDVIPVLIRTILAIGTEEAVVGKFRLKHGNIDSLTRQCLAPRPVSLFDLDANQRILGGVVIVVRPHLLAIGYAVGSHCLPPRIRIPHHVQP